MTTTLVLVKHALPILDPAMPAREWRLGTQAKLDAKRLARRLRSFIPLRLVASPEPKAMATGEIVAAELGVQISAVEGLREIDRPVLRLMSKAEHERVNKAIFADVDRPALGTESARAALRRFSDAIRSELQPTAAPTLVAVTHGTVISLFVAAHNDTDAFALWKKLTCGSFVVLDAPSFGLRELVVDEP